MQKKLIALAVAGVASGAAFAQTNVTMYGVADAGYVYMQGDAGLQNPNLPKSATNRDLGKNKFSGVQSGLLSGSRIGFRGEEALGNGLKAIFTLEYGLDIDGNYGVGTGAVASRQQYVGLSGRAGTLTLGRQYAPGYDATARNDPFGGAAFAPQSYLTTSSGANNTITPNNNARWNNAIAYSTPNWGGFTGKAIYSFGETQTTSQVWGRNDQSITDNSRYGLGANFAAGPINVDAVYQVRQNVTTTPVSAIVAKPYGEGRDITEYYLGATLDLKAVKLMATFQDQDDDNNNHTATNWTNRTWSLGAVVPIGNGNIHVGYAQLDWNQGKNLAGTKTGMWNGKTDSFGIAYTHGLSKRTTLYAGYIFTDNDKNAKALGVASNAVAAAGEENHTFAAGIRHTF